MGVGEVGVGRHGSSSHIAGRVQVRHLSWDYQQLWLKSISFDGGGQYRAWNGGRSQGPVQLGPVGLVDSGDVAVVRHAAIVALIVAVNTAYYDMSRNHYIGQAHFRLGFFSEFKFFLFLNNTRLFRRCEIYSWKESGQSCCQITLSPSPLSVRLADNTSDHFG